ncbi:hypothetical protein CKAN_01759100 [Cinnamomum micranthum f. kanehirae]|uniref:Uncharacterized protein n=1 Tax=Cinnamomum micranthum f. kanehirae TaxID=337451 RepID=A0A3S3MYB9_9MAGN|nr:hypothetical protein CKAN_01759100 [Cinnamomum micranthum f. kanehirae]
MRILSCRAIPCHGLGTLGLARPDPLIGPARSTRSMGWARPRHDFFGARPIPLYTPRLAGPWFDVQQVSPPSREPDVEF